MKQPHIYIIIVNFLNWQDTEECIESVLASAYKQYSIIVVDNNSGNQSLEHLQKRFSAETGCQIIEQTKLDELSNPLLLPKLLLAQNDRNTGFGAANNIIIRQIIDKDAYIWLLNPDVTVQADTLKELVDFAGGLAEKKIIGSVVNSWYKKDKTVYYGGCRISFNSATVEMITSPEKISTADYICGTSLFAHASLFKITGLFQEEYFLYWEETDWCYSARMKGVGLSVCMSAICYDKGSSVIGKGLLAGYYYTRNGLYFIRKYKKEKLMLAVPMVLPRYLKWVFMGQWNRAKGVRKGFIAFIKNKRYEME